MKASIKHTAVWLVVVCNLVLCSTAFRREKGLIDGDGEDQKRAIVNGNKAKDYIRPFYARVNVFRSTMFNDTHKMRKYVWCGSTITHTRVVVTAAHCLHSETRSVESIEYITLFADEGPSRIFSIDVPHNVKEYYVKKWVIHEDYDFEVHHADLALLFITSEFKFHMILKPCNKSYSTNQLAACGKGVTDPNSELDKMPADLLMEMKLKEANSEECNVNIHEWDIALEICGKDSSGKSSICHGDSGGPLYPINATDHAICHYGVTSFGDGEMCKSDAIFVRVNAYAEWISDEIAKYLKNEDNEETSEEFNDFD